MQLFFSGKLKVSGNPTLAMKLQKLFSYQVRALRGVRVLDLSRLLPGPFASLVLADLGASVDKIEDTDAGDYLRHMPPLVGDGAEANERDFSSRSIATSAARASI